MSAIVEQFMAYRHKRVPVYRGHRDNVLGFLCAEDILQLILDDTDLAGLSLDELLRPAAMVPGTRKIDEMFDYLQANEQQAVIVMDEFGGVDGLLTMNDVLACIFGRAQADSERARISYDQGQNVYELPGSTKLLDLNSMTSLVLEDRRMTTVAGLVLRHLDRLPVEGDQVSVSGYLIEVLSMDGPRVGRVRVTVHKDAEQSA
jgi:CBS domain containing-hemolysin-like protein